MLHNRIVFWQVTPSPHQAPWIRALADMLPLGQVIGVFQQELSPRRLAMGWVLPDYGKTHVLISPDQSTVHQLLSTDTKRTVHVFSSVVHCPQINAAFKKALSFGSLVGILSEGRDWRGWKGLMRQAHALMYESRYRQQVDFVLAIGRVGLRWFSLCGYDAAKLFEFCYVVEKHNFEGSKNFCNHRVLLVSIGRLIELKRHDLLLKALSKLLSYEWRLKIIGDGARRSELENLVKYLDLEKRTVFEGTLDNHKVREQLSLSDILVMSSRADGWGAVVNEALMSGVPVICSDYCGAADLVRVGFNGDLFECDDIDSLTLVLKEWIAKGPLPWANRNRIREWSECIEGANVARYFLNILKFLENNGEVRPIAPWRF